MLRNALAALAVLSVAALAACGSSSTSGSPTPGAGSTATPTVAATVAPTVAPTPTPAPPTVELTGTWSGQYTGPFNGTFTLTWTQTGSKVDGTIKLSSPPDTLNINGNLTGNAISFGAVGVVTYTGTVNGKSMSGSYTDLANGQKGSWSATES